LLTNAPVHSEGVLSDHDDTVVIKPCTAAEIAFYQSANASYPDLAYFMPTFMGTLELNPCRASSNPPTAEDSPIQLPLQNTLPVPIPSSHLDPLAAIAHSQPRSINSSPPSTPDPLRLKGKAIDTDTCIVLSAVTSGFKRPNILDLKLGAKLWADDAPQAKRTRLDKVSQETTSTPLGFRIAGMRVWKGSGSHPASQRRTNTGTMGGNSSTVDATSGWKDSRHGHVEYEEDTNYLVYNKFYGRSMTTDTILEGFKDYFIVPSAGVGRHHALELIRHFRAEIKEIHDVLEGIESRMYSSSILLVYEGDPEAYQDALEYQRQKREERREQKDDHNADEDFDGDMEDEEEERRTYAIKLIDFAHASLAPGQGPDQNVLHGVRSTIQLLEDLEAHLRGG
jgi:inositol-polyphosphate multikinase